MGFAKLMKIALRARIVALIFHVVTLGFVCMGVRSSKISVTSTSSVCQGAASIMSVLTL
jgi:hypothetical protein